MMDWLVNIFGLPKEFLYNSGTGGGVIQGSASESSLCALLAAKYHTAQLHKVDHSTEIIEKIVVYTSDQTHSSVKRSCIIMGIPGEHFREIPTDASSDYALDPVKLEEAIKKDIEAGLWPSAVVSSLGTTGCCAYDPIDKISPIAKKYNLWHHVDAAYAGAAFVCPELRVNGIESIDSFITNPHKWLLTNHDCSLLWTKDKFSLIN
jgi:glutamate/tyrosine decarboxylase-like PLP-dependent enzyme